MSMETKNEKLGEMKKKFFLARCAIDITTERLACNIMPYYIIE